MWCSNCGKTIRPEDDACRHCGASLGESRFYGNAYTSSQVRLPVEALNEAPEGGMISYTRTSYMSYDNQPEDDVYSNTTYRPLLSDEEDIALQEAEEAAAQEAEEAETQADAEENAQPDGETGEDEFGDAQSAEDAAQENGEAGAEEDFAAEDVGAAEYEEEPAEDIMEESTSPLPPIKKAAISPRVLSYMEEMEKSQQKRSGKLRMPSFMKKSVPAVGEEEAEEELPEAGDAYYKPDESAAEEVGASAEPGAENVESYEDAYDYGEEDAGSAEEYVSDAETDDFAEYGDEDDLADEEEDRLGLDFSAFKKIDVKGLLQNRILKISVAVVLIVAVIAAGAVWLSYVTTKRPKIADVTYQTYSQGIEILQQHIGEEYRNEMTDAYMVNTAYANQTFAGNLKELDALLPEEPKSNDALFIAALTNIQDAIAEAIIADANAEVNGTAAQRAETSTRDWQAIENAVAKLVEANTAGQLTVIVTDLNSIVAPTSTPTIAPTEVVYQPLSNGMMDNVEVKKMQNRLINLGFLDGEADGDFGNGTETAVKAFQRAAGLTADGIASHETQKAMYAEDAPRNNVSAEATDAPPVG